MINWLNYTEDRWDYKWRNFNFLLFKMKLQLSDVTTLFKVESFKSILSSAYVLSGIMRDIINNNEKICIAQTLKTSDALMAH